MKAPALLAPGESPLKAMSDLPDNLPLGLAALQREAAGALPPVDDWHPAHCGDIAIRIARDGRWFHDGRLIARKELVRLFSTLLRKDGDDFVLVTPAEKLRIIVEDAPFLAVLLDIEGEGSAQKLVFTTNVGDVAVAGAANPIRVVTDVQTDEPSPYVHVRSGLEARLSRAVFYQLAALAAPGLEEDVLGVWSQGVFFTLGKAR
ncbi:MAG TPA: DUF1285 domain-containing protein [Rhizomicrobium sp.]